VSERLNPALFRPEAVSAETSSFNLDLAHRVASQPPPANLSEARARFLRGESPIPATPKSPLASNLAIRGRQGVAVGLRIIAPSRPRGVFLHIHGGGWRLGAADMRDEPLEYMAEHVGLACVSVEYRLAPEHPYPAAADDCEAAALWLIEHAKQMFGTTRLIIGGESSGAHLAVVTLLRVRAAGHAHAFCGANLIFGVYDLSLTPSVRRAKATLVTGRSQIEQAVAGFLPAGMDPRDPDVSPLYADLQDLPPALFTVGTLDPLLDDSLFMWARWIAAGNPADIAVYPGGLHGFTTFPSSLAREASRRIEAFLVSRAAAGA
jgi:acetyl esterase